MEDLTSKEEYEELDIPVQPMNGKSIGPEGSDTNTINDKTNKKECRNKCFGIVSHYCTGSG